MTFSLVVVVVVVDGSFFHVSFVGGGLLVYLIFRYSTVLVG